MNLTPREIDKLHIFMTAELARKRAYLLQQRRVEFPFQVLEIVLLGRIPHLEGRKEEETDVKQARFALNRLDSEEFSDRIYPTLSGGEASRVDMARTITQDTDLLLLDEPTNHLDAESVAWLERFLKDYPGTVVAITHDRYFLDNVAGWILELDRGKGIPYEGNYSSWLEQKQKRLQQEESQEKARQRTLASELEWIRQSPRARQDKSKARLAAYETLLAEAKEKTPDTAQIIVPVGPRLGSIVIEADSLQKGYEDKLLIEDLSFKLPPGGIVGVIGANGSGKTTIFNILLGMTLLVLVYYMYMFAEQTKT